MTTMTTSKQIEEAKKQIAPNRAAVTAMKALAASLEILRDLLTLENPKGTIAVVASSAVRIAKLAAETGNVAGHLPEITEKMGRVEQLSFDEDLRHLTLKMLHASILSLEAVEEALGIPARDFIMY